MCIFEVTTRGDMADLVSKKTKTVPMSDLDEMRQHVKKKKK